MSGSVTADPRLASVLMKPEKPRRDDHGQLDLRAHLRNALPVTAPPLTARPPVRIGISP